jgi:hypothetical protein
LEYDDYHDKQINQNEIWINVEPPSKNQKEIFFSKQNSQSQQPQSKRPSEEGD